MSSLLVTLTDIVESIAPYDERETQDKVTILRWINSGQPIYRISKPDNPPKHLISYFVLFDKQANALMLIDHKKADLWLPAGGHIEVDESPKDTVIREAKEELRISADFSTTFGDMPLFVAITETRGDKGKHTDVSLWYVLAGNIKDSLWFDVTEMRDYKWLPLDQILNTDINTLDPCMHRFVLKMKKATSSVG